MKCLITSVRSLRVSKWVRSSYDGTSVMAQAFFIVFSAGFFTTVRKAPLLTVTDIEYLKYRGRSKVARAVNGPEFPWRNRLFFAPCKRETLMVPITRFGTKDRLAHRRKKAVSKSNHKIAATKQCTSCPTLDQKGITFIQSSTECILGPKKRFVHDEKTRDAIFGL